MPYEIGFPMILTSGAFPNHKSNKQTSHELQKNLDSSYIHFVHPVEKVNNMIRWDTKLCQLQLSENKFPDAAYIFRMNSHVKF